MLAGNHFYRCRIEDGKVGELTIKKAQNARIQARPSGGWKLLLVESTYIFMTHLREGNGSAELIQLATRFAKPSIALQNKNISTRDRKDR